MKPYLLTLLPITTLYLLFSFCFVNINFAYWPKEARVIFAFYSTVIIFIFIIVNISKKSTT